MAIEYLGNKTRLLKFLLGPMTSVPGITAVADLFCGTASVASEFRRAGKRVVANDHLELCAVLAEAALLTDGSPSFHSLEIPCQPGETAYHAVIRHLNAVPPATGFFYRTYSPASQIPRMYLTEANAAKIDGIRNTIAAWEPFLTRAERAVLLRDLAAAVVTVSNTAGTFGCFLKQWKARALASLVLYPGSTSRFRTPHEHEVWREDAQAATARLTGIDAVYLDPPYTKRQYAAYYHLLETLVAGTQPVVGGSTGLPAWEHKSSAFCYRRKAPDALSRLVSALDVRHVFLSYSDDGHIRHDEIIAILGQHGTLRFWEQPVSRYRSSALDQNRPVVHERLYHVARPG